MRPSSVLVSAVVHGAALTALIVVPLVASYDLPDVHVPSLPYIRVHSPRLPEAPPAPAPPEPARPAANTGAVPLEPPVGISPERPISPPEHEGVVGGVEPLSETGVPFGIGSEGPAAVPPPPPPRPSAPLRVGGAVRPPRRIAYVAPEYPPLAQAARVEGDVQLDAIIGVNGTIQQVRVLRPAPLLEAAAIDAVRQWRYTPTLLNGTPVPVVMTVTVSFRLR